MGSPFYNTHSGCIAKHCENIIVPQNPNSLQLAPILSTQMEVTMRATQSLMGSALVGACSLAFSPAVAEPLSDSEKIERLERLTDLLQKQLNRQNDLIRELRQEGTRAGKKSGKET